MFDIGWSEIAIVLLVALIVIGPRDLPRVARNIGRWVAKGRAMAREFQTSLEDMAREAELDDVKREIEKAGGVDLGKTIEKTVDPTGELGKAFDTNASGDKTTANAVSSGARDPAAKAADSTANAAKPTAASETASATVKTSEQKPGPSEAKRTRQSAKTASARTRAAKARTAEASATKAPVAKTPARKSAARAKSNGAPKAKAAVKTPASDAAPTDAEAAARDPALAEIS